MLMFEAIHIVLHCPQHPGNIGAAARAMKTMGLTQLRLVNPRQFPDAQSYARAAGADDLLDNAQRFASLADAVADCRLVIGSTAQQRMVPMPEWTPAHAAEQVYEAVAGVCSPVAIVFGPERTGLENADLQLCHASICIPTDKDFSSLNLAAAVQVICYALRAHWLQAQPVVATPLADSEPVATHEQLERFFAHLDETLYQIDFHKGRDSKIVMQRLRRLFLRSDLDQREVRILHGILADTQRMARLAGSDSKTD